MKRIVLTILIMTATTALGGNAFAGEIVLNDTVEARYLFVKFSDVATVVGVSQEEISRINAIFCGPAPEPDKTREITVDYLKMRLRQSGFDPADFRFSGSRVVKLENVVVVELPLCADPDGGDEPPSSLRRKIETAILECAAGELGVDSTDMAVEVRNIGKALLGLGDSAEVVSVRPARDINGPGRVTFSVLARKGEREVRSGVIAEIGRRAQIAVAAEEIPADTVITGGMVTIKRVLVSSNMSDYFTSPQDLVGLRTKRNVASDQAVTGAMVERPILVKRSDVVKVIVRIAGTKSTVEANARADQSGRKGEFIRVTNVDSKKTFLAEVVGPRQVQVVLGED
jgi:flagella basal body P-ring formation protein FlgA